MHPEVQQKAFEEVQSSLGDLEGETTIADLNKLNYLDLVVKENFQLYPSVPFIGRTFLEDTTLSKF
jgi:cytochrome P450